MTENKTIVTKMPRGKLAIEHADIRFKNFEGRPDKFHPDGYPYGIFAIFLDEDSAAVVASTGFNVKTFGGSDGQSDPQLYLNVKVSHKFFPADVHKIVGESDILFDPDTICGLDHSDIIDAGIVINPYRYDVNGNTGVTAYLDNGSYFELMPSPFAAKFIH